MPDPVMSEELKHALGKPSTYRSGPDPSDVERAAKPAPAADAERGNSLFDHIKSYFTGGGREEPRVGPNGQGLNEAVDAMSGGIKSAPKTPEE